jgi:hypothetical protein
MPESKKAAVQKYKAAKQALAAHMDAGVQKHGKRNVPESDEYRRLNKAVADAEPGVSWWRR